jgi:hypothetical protein
MITVIGSRLWRSAIDRPIIVRPAPARGHVTDGLRFPAALNYAGRVASDYDPGFDVLDDDRARANDGSSTNDGSWPDERIGADPTVVIDLNWRLLKGHARSVVVVCSGAEMRALRHRDPRANGDRTEIIDECVLPDSAPVANTQVPREVNGCRAVNVHVPTNLRATYSE